MLRSRFVRATLRIRNALQHNLIKKKNAALERIWAFQAYRVTKNPFKKLDIVLTHEGREDPGLMDNFWHHFPTQLKFDPLKRASLTIPRTFSHPLSLLLLLCIYFIFTALSVSVKNIKYTHIHAQKVEFIYYIYIYSNYHLF